jgi:hypothetical protein
MLLTSFRSSSAWRLTSALGSTVDCIRSRRRPTSILDSGWRKAPKAVEEARSTIERSRHTQLKLSWKLPGERDHFQPIPGLKLCKVYVAKGTYYVARGKMLCLEDQYLR